MQKKLPLSDSQRQILQKKRLPFKLSPFEIGVIKALRSFKFGNITVHLHNGIPLRYTYGSSHAIDPTKPYEGQPANQD